jgi:hypothetical protein
MPMLWRPGYNSSAVDCMGGLSSIGARRAAAALTVVCCCVPVAACGSSEKPRPGAGAQAPSVVGFAVCMRSHGVPNFPDASSGPGGGVSIVPAQIDTSSPAFERAISVCKRLLPGLNAHQPASAKALRQLLQFSECMRSHGVTGFPDPTSTPPVSHNGYSMMLRRGGAYLAVPATISPSSPGYQRARAACRFGPVFS